MLFIGERGAEKEVRCEKCFRVFNDSEEYRKTHRKGKKVSCFYVEEGKLGKKNVSFFDCEFCLAKSIPDKFRQLHITNCKNKKKGDNGTQDASEMDDSFGGGEDHEPNEDSFSRR